MVPPAIGLPPAPPAVPPQMLDNAGQNCWADCTQTDGVCSGGFCGPAGACCRLSFSGSTAACGFGLVGCQDYHCCALASPPTPPSWPPHQLLVDPGEYSWPSEWFGNFSMDPQHVMPMPWVTSGERPGYDFGLPPYTRPASRGLLVLKRTFLVLPDPPTVHLPQLAFRANPVYCMWLDWRSIEPTAGSYRLDALMATYEHTIRSGWKFALRLLTSRVAEAPVFLSSMNISTINGGINYDPSSPAFHARYLALLSALRSRGLCQKSDFVMGYVGYASTSWGDEYIGPHADENRGTDPAYKYSHVRERLDAWASLCENATNKVMMGGESAYGRSLGFGTRNGFVEHCASATLDPTTSGSCVVLSIPFARLAPIANPKVVGWNLPHRLVSDPRCRLWSAPQSWRGGRSVPKGQ